MQAKSVFRQVTLAYEALIKTASSFQSLFLLAVRLYWGWQFAQSGWGKLQHLPKVANFFATLGIPAPAFSAVAISWLEFYRWNRPCSWPRLPILGTLPRR
jgi:putative oxidoreductase